MTNPYDIDLDRNPANFQPLTPLTFLERAASVYPAHTAVIHGPLRRTYVELYARTRRLASALAKRGIKRGDTVSVMLANTPASTLAMVDALTLSSSRRGTVSCWSCSAFIFPGRTRAVRLRLKAVVQTQPVVPSESRTSLHASVSRVISTGRPARRKIHATGNSAPGPWCSWTLSDFRLAKRGTC